MIMLSAIKTKNNIIFTGIRHSEIIKHNCNIDFSDCIHGFVKEDSDFLTREEAYLEAVRCGQIIDDGEKILTSEDLWYDF